MLDVYSRRVVGWSIDSSQTATLVTDALGMAIHNRKPAAGTIIHSDHGTQGGFNWPSQHLGREVVRWAIRSGRRMFGSTGVRFRHRDGRRWLGVRIGSGSGW